MGEMEQFTTSTKDPIVAVHCADQKTIVVTSRSFFLVPKLGVVKPSHSLPISDAARLFSCIFLTDTLLAVCVEDKGSYYLALLCLSTNTMIASSPELQGPVYASKTLTAYSIGRTVVFAFVNKAGFLNVWPSRGTFLEPLAQFVQRHHFSAVVHIYSSIVAAGTTTGHVLLIDTNGMRLLRTLEPFQQQCTLSRAADCGLVTRLSMMVIAQPKVRSRFMFGDDDMTDSAIETYNENDTTNRNDDTNADGNAEDTEMDPENCAHINAARELFLQSILWPSQYADESDIFIDELGENGAKKISHIVCMSYNPNINALASLSAGRSVSYYFLESHTSAPAFFSTYRCTCIAPGSDGFLIGDGYGTVLHVTLSENRLDTSAQANAVSTQWKPPPLVQLAGCSRISPVAVDFVAASNTVIVVAGGHSLSLCTYPFLQKEMRRESADFLRQSLSLAFNPVFLNKCFISLNGHLTRITHAEPSEMSMVAQIDCDLATIYKDRDPDSVLRQAVAIKPSAAHPPSATAGTGLTTLPVTSGTTVKSLLSHITISQASLPTSRYEQQEQMEYDMSSATVFGEQLFIRVIKNSLRDFYRLLVSFGVQQPFFTNVNTGKLDRIEFIKQIFAFQDTLSESTLAEVVQLQSILQDKSELLASTIVRVRSAIWKAYSDIITTAYFFGAQLQQIRGILIDMTKSVRSLSSCIIEAAYKSQLYLVDAKKFEKMLEDLQKLID